MADNIFTRKERVRGILSITNLSTGRIYLAETEDAVASFRSERFSLDLGMHRNRELQREYSETGLELFSIDLDAEAGESQDLGELLEQRISFYREKGTPLYGV